MSTATAFKALVRKDIAIFLRDRRALLVSIVTPIVLAAFFGFLFGGSGAVGTIAKMPIGVADLDGSALSKAVVADLMQDATLAVEAMPEERAKTLVKSGKIHVAVIFPPGFGAAAPAALMGSGQKPQLTLLFDPSQGMARPVAAGALTQHIMQEVTRPFANGMSVPYRLDSVAVSSGPRYNGYAHSFAGMSVQFILFMGIDAGVALLLLRQQGMWRRLRAAPLSLGVLLAARLTATTLIALAILAVVYAAAHLIFGVQFAGSFLGFVMVAGAFALLAATAGLMIAALGRSVGATRGVAIFAVLILVMLGGAWVPAFLFPDWLQHVTTFVPTRWAVDGLDAMTWRGLPLRQALAPTAILLAWSIGFALIALWRFDWE